MLVNTVTDLDNVRTNLGGTYALGRDIDATGTKAASHRSATTTDPLQVSVAFSTARTGRSAG